MTLHPPKQISSIEGLGLNTTKTMAHVSDTLAIGREEWSEMNEPWREGEVIIAEPGYTWATRWEVDVPYIVTKFLNADSQLVGVYCDVSYPVEKIEGGFAFTDLYLDVWQPAGKGPTVLDEDELAAAVEAKYVTPEEADKARKVAREITDRLMSEPHFLQF